MVTPRKTPTDPPTPPTPPNTPETPSEPVAEQTWIMDPATGGYIPGDLTPVPDAGAAPARPMGPAVTAMLPPVAPTPAPVEDPVLTGQQPPTGIMPAFLTPEEDAALKRYATMQAEQTGWLPAPPLGSASPEVTERARYPAVEDDALYEVMVDTLGSGPFVLSKGDRFTAAQMLGVHKHQATGARVGAGTKGASEAYDLPWLLHHGSVRKVGTLRQERA